MGSTWGLLSLFRGDNHVPSSVYPVCLHPLFYPYQLSELLPHQPWGWWFLHLYNPWPWWCHPRPSGCLPPSSKNPSLPRPTELLPTVTRRSTRLVIWSLPWSLWFVL